MQGGLLTIGCEYPAAFHSMGPGGRAHGAPQAQAVTSPPSFRTLAACRRCSAAAASARKASSSAAALAALISRAVSASSFSFCSLPGAGNGSR